MRFVILRDDDTNGLTPAACLERLYRPFLDRGLPVNLAVIPEVRANAMTPDGRPEGFLLGKKTPAQATVPIAQNRELVAWLQGNRGCHIVQHGCYHDPFEFDCPDRGEIRRRLETGSRRLAEAGFEQPRTFVAPHDKFSPASFREIAGRFRVISTGWFELSRLPRTWWPGYLIKKLRHAPHWRAGRTLLLSHPGCLLSCHRPYDQMLASVKASVASRRLTVLVTHWWEYFRNQQPDEPFIALLHETAAYLAGEPQLKVIGFDELAAAPHWRI